MIRNHRMAVCTVTLTMMVAIASNVFAAVSFSSTHFGMTGRPLGLAFGDFNDDGHQDLVTGLTTTIVVYLGDGTGSFPTSTAFTVPGVHTVASVGTGDIDDDGDLDVTYTASADSGNHYVGVMKNGGTGVFTAGGRQRPAYNLMFAVTADFNHDGRADVVTGGFTFSGGHFVYVMQGTATGGLTGPAAYAVAGASWQIQPIDFDGDSDLDLVIGTFSERVYFFTNNGSGGFSVSFTTPNSGTLSPLATLGDLNGDNILDLVASDTNGSRLFVQLGTGTLTFGPATALSSSNRVGWGHIADIDGDGLPDIVAHRDSNTGITIHRGRGNGTFDPRIVLGPLNTSIGFDWADLDEDGRLDFGINDFTGPNGGFLIYLNRSTPPPAPPTIAVTVAMSDGLGPNGWYNAASSGIDGILLTATATDPQNVSSLICRDNGVTVLSVSPAPPTSPLAGSFTLGNGTHPIVCTAVDGDGISGSTPAQTFNVDQVAPAILVADVTADATTPSGAAVTFSAPASDSGSGVVPPVTCSHSSGSVFPIGDTPVTCAATDVAGNSSDVGFHVIVRDVPNCATATATVAELWPVDHRLVTVRVQGVTDLDGDVMTIAVTGIWQDEPTNSESIAWMSIDGFIVGPNEVQVRAQRGLPRPAVSNGRVYHILFTASDGHGGTCTGDAKVGAPPRQGMPSVDDGLRYDSTIAVRQ